MASVGFVGLAGFAQGLVAPRYTSVSGVGLSGARIMRYSQPDGVIADCVMFRASATSPEAPFASGRVWLLRAIDGYKAWEGYSDAQGYYRADGLELGVAYIAVGIDPWGTHKAVGAGPVVAQEAA